MAEVFFCWTVSVVCGKTAGAASSKISNRPVTFESESSESNLEASQVPNLMINKHAGMKPDMSC